MTSDVPNPESPDPGRDAAGGDSRGHAGTGGGVGAAGSAGGPDGAGGGAGGGAGSPDSAVAAVDVATLAAVEIVGIYAADLMTAAAVKLGLFEGGDAHRDLAEARILITALAGFVDAVAPQIGHHHAAPLRDGLATLQRTFREYSPVPDQPGQGPGEKYTGPVH